MAKKRIDQALVQRAKATAFLQTDPEAQSLTQLLRGAASDFAGQVAVERGAARGVVSTINAAVPKVTSYYGQADQTRAAAQQYVDQRLAPLSHAADDIKAGSAAEAAGFMRRLGETRAATLGEFQSRKVDAKAGAAFAVRAARDQYRVDSGKVKSQLVDLNRRKGVITTVALGDAIKAEEQAAAARRTENRLVTGQKETARHNRATEGQAKVNSRQRRQAAKKKETAAAAKLALGVLGVKPRAETQGSHKIKGQIINARAEYERQIHAGKPLSQIAADARKNKVPEYVLAAAADLATRGYISHGHVVGLRQAGTSHIPRTWRTPRKYGSGQATGNVAHVS